MAEEIPFEPINNKLTETLNGCMTSLVQLYSRIGSKLDLPSVGNIFEITLGQSYDELLKHSEQHDNEDDIKPSEEELKQVEEYIKKHNDYIKSIFESQLRSFCWEFRNTITQNGLQEDTIFLYFDLLFVAVERQICYNSLPLSVIEEYCSTLTTKELPPIIDYLSERIEIIVKGINTSAVKKNTFLRMCNELQRRCTTLKDSPTKGLLKVLLVKAFSFNDSSGLNIKGEFNLNAIPSYDETQDKYKDASEEDKMNHRMLLDLIGLLNNPPKILELESFRKFQKSVDWILSKFREASDQIRKLKKVYRDNRTKITVAVQEANSKRIIKRPISDDLLSSNLYQLPTSIGIVSYQLNDLDFQRSILVQILIVLQYLKNVDDMPKTSKESAARPPENFRFTTQQKNWIDECYIRNLATCRDSPFAGDQFSRYVKQVLDIEVAFNEWKDNGCSRYRRVTDTVQSPGLNAEAIRTLTLAENEERKKYRKIAQENFKKLSNPISLPSFKMGSKNLEQLWNVGEGRRTFSKEFNIDYPTPDFKQFVEEKSNEVNEFEPNDEYRRTLSWKAMRLCAQSNVSLIPKYQTNDILEMKKMIEEEKQAGNTNNVQESQQ